MEHFLFNIQIYATWSKERKATNKRRGAKRLEGLWNIAKGNILPDLHVLLKLRLRNILPLIQTSAFLAYLCGPPA